MRKKAWLCIRTRKIPARKLVVKDGSVSRTRLLLYYTTTTIAENVFSGAAWQPLAPGAKMSMQRVNQPRLLTALTNPSKLGVPVFADTGLRKRFYSVATMHSEIPSVLLYNRSSTRDLKLNTLSVFERYSRGGIHSARMQKTPPLFTMDEIRKYSDQMRPSQRRSKRVQYEHCIRVLLDLMYDMQKC
jgi:hypothetical protein